ncbi:hypothetical protein BDW42DRAFT_176358 [Aspergillus taichungensis]|uniref:GPI anchored protein n=1 Tax=Aspergillus taichungensis TaxID=482145 RepID=A0A2J5HKN1_9EURO|nr:hypothetical protein BDW42DRAFT_176358 [Aspergillus taichungensis]
MQLTKALCIATAALAPLALAQEAPAPETVTYELLRVADLTSTTAPPSSTSTSTSAPITSSSTATPTSSFATPTSTPIWGSSSSVGRTPTKSASTPIASNSLPHTGDAASMTRSPGVLAAVVMAAAAFVF